MCVVKDAVEKKQLAADADAKKERAVVKGATKKKDAEISRATKKAKVIFNLLLLTRQL